MRTFNPLYDRPGDYMGELARKLTEVEDALRKLAEEPGNPHHAAEEALKILNRES